MKNFFYHLFSMQFIAFALVQMEKFFIWKIKLQFFHDHHPRLTLLSNNDHFIFWSMQCFTYFLFVPCAQPPWHRRYNELLCHYGFLVATMKSKLNLLSKRLLLWGPVHLVRHLRFGNITADWSHHRPWLCMPIPVLSNWWLCAAYVGRFPGLKYVSLLIWPENQLKALGKASKISLQMVVWVSVSVATMIRKQ